MNEWLSAFWKVGSFFFSLENIIRALIYGFVLIFVVAILSKIPLPKIGSIPKDEDDEIDEI